MQVREGSSDLLMFLSVVMIDWGDLRGQILKYFSALGSHLVGRCAHWLQNYVTSPWPAGPYFSLTPTTRPIAIELGREKSRKAARTARAAGAAVFPVTAKREKNRRGFFPVCSSSCLHAII